MCGGIFCDGTRRNLFPEVHSQKDARGNCFPETFFPGIVITNTTTLQPNFGSLFALKNSFHKKNDAVYMHV
jgi:hypothetical protein